jgi:hypothetical protein
MTAAVGVRRPLPVGNLYSCDPTSPILDRFSQAVMSLITQPIECMGMRHQNRKAHQGNESRQSDKNRQGATLFPLLHPLTG